MKKVLAAALATMFMLASVPAFACGGDENKSAKKDSDETLMTSVDGGGDKADDAKKAKKAKKSKEAKKDEDEKTEESEGEV